MEQSQPAHLSSISELFSETITFFQQHWQVFAPIVVIGALPTLLHNILVPDTFSASHPLALLLSLLSLVASIWMATTMLLVLRKLVEGQTVTSPIDAYRDSAPYIIPLFITGLIYGVIVAFGFLLLIIPGIIFAVWGFATQYVFMFENIQNYDAFKRSKELVEGHWFDVFLRWFVLILAIIVISIALALIPYIGQLIAQIITAPVSLYYLYLVYKDLRDSKAMMAAK